MSETRFANPLANGLCMRGGNARLLTPGSCCRRFPRGGPGWALWLRLGSVAVAVAVAVAGAGAVAVAVAVIVAAARAVAVAQVGRLALIMNNTGPCTTTS